MPRNKVYAIVEGQGEADPPTPSEQPAVATLTLRLLQHFGCYDLFPAPRPWRLRSSGEFFRDDVLERALRAHTAFADCAGVLVLMDLEDDCPGLRGPELAEHIRNMGGDLPFSVVVTCAYRDYETWFLVSLDAIHPGESYPGNAESHRDAKGWLRKRFGYREVRDQARYTRSLDIEATRERSRSFRRLCHAFEELIAARAKDQPIVTPRSGEAALSVGNSEVA